tara:strand:- start:646 stop:1044 length:399 start_codon:yes stop_codon:yes gene_type:complete
MNSFFRKTASPLVSSIFKKGVGGLTSLFKKAPALQNVVGQVRKASNVANKITNNPVFEAIAKQQGYGNQFNLAKRGAGGLNKVADAGDIGVRLQRQTRDLRQSVVDRDINNILEKAKAIKGNVDEVRAIKFE